MIKKSIISWSGGKDSALALYKVQQADEFSVEKLLTTITQPYDRISMHGVRSSLLRKQAASIGTPLLEINLPKDVSDESYADIMKREMLQVKTKGIETVIFGDLFLEDVRKYREENLAKVGMHPIFPLWKISTKELAANFIKLGFKAILTSVDSEALDGSFIGHLYDKEFLSSIPSSVDPCGENGEFHTFVFDGPIFNHPISFKKGEIVFRNERFYYIDLI